MTIYRVDHDGDVSVKPIITTLDFAEMMTVHPVDLEELEADFMGIDQEAVDTLHHFAPGVYMREARFKAGSFIIGHKQAGLHLNLMLDGHLTFINGQEVKAPFMGVGLPGRKCCVVHKDTSWFNIYATEEQDIGALEGMFLEKSNLAVKQECDAATIITDEVLAARSDYRAALVDIGFTHEQVVSLSNYMDDRISLPYGAYKFRAAPSPIAGNGVFASASIKTGETIGQANILGKRTILGYGINHSGNPNAEFVVFKNGLNVIARRDIRGNHGGVYGEEITVDYRQSRKVASCLVQ